MITKIKIFILAVILTANFASNRFAKEEGPKRPEERNNVLYHDLLTVSKVINQLQPLLSKKTSENYAKTIYYYSSLYSIDWRLVVAISFRESSFVFMAHPKKNDHGLMGVSCLVWCKELGLDLKRLQTDREYSIVAGIRVLDVIKRRHELKDKKWIGRYNSRYKLLKTNYLAAINSILLAIATIENTKEK